MKIYNEITTIFNDITGQWETMSEDSFEYNGLLTLAAVADDAVVQGDDNFTSGTTSMGTITGYRPFKVQFVNNSTGGGLSYMWDFGDGGQSSLENPIHTYTLSGTYNVSLQATNANGGNIVVGTVQVQGGGYGGGDNQTSDEQFGGNPPPVN